MVASSIALHGPDHARNDLPAAGDSAISEGYRELLGLISHEYFHAWNVKEKIRPAAFVGQHGYDTTQEAYTRLLWLFEGFTSYYDDLMLKRVGLVTTTDHLKLIGRRLTQLLRSPGRQRQSVADASFDAWIKYYRADENAVNSQFSYYLRGSFVAMALDLMQRAAGEDAPTLDDLMHALWREFGQTGRGVPETRKHSFSQWAQRDLGPFFQQYVNGTEDRTGPRCSHRSALSPNAPLPPPPTEAAVTSQTSPPMPVRLACRSATAARCRCSSTCLPVLPPGGRGSVPVIDCHRRSACRQCNVRQSTSPSSAKGTGEMMYFRHDELRVRRLRSPSPARHSVA